jgi:hypothetical protein
MGSKPIPPPAEALADKCERLVLEMNAPTVQSDFRISTQLVRILLAMKASARREPLNEEAIKGVIDAAMRARRLYIVELPDGRSTVKQHPLPAREPRRKH